MMNNNSQPLVSVVMCVYNTPEEYLIQATRSILEQTYNNFEFIIVDDYSSYGLFQDEIFKDKRITLLRNNKNYGPSYSRNRAIELAKGKYIAIMDSDDISLPTRLEKQVEYMENNPDVVVAGSWFKFIGIKNHEVKKIIDDNEYYRSCLIFGNSPTLLNPSATIRKEILDKCHIRFDEKLKYGEDYKLWIQLSRLGRVTNYKEVLLLYRTHEKQATYNNGKKRQSSFDDNVVKQEEILDVLKLELNENDKDLYYNYLNASNYNPKNYIKVLDRIVEANKLTHVYQEDKLESRVHEQWISVIQHIRNPFRLMSLLFSQKGRRKEIMGIKFKQLFSHIFKKH